MPAGNTCIKPPAKVVEKVTAKACIAIARRVQRARRLSGDVSGSEAARLVARFIEEELLGDHRTDLEDPVSGAPARYTLA